MKLLYKKLFSIILKQMNQESLIETLYTKINNLSDYIWESEKKISLLQIDLKEKDEEINFLKNELIFSSSDHLLR